MILVDGCYFRKCCKLSSISSDNVRVLLMYCRTFLRTFLICSASCFVAYGSCCLSRFFRFIFMFDFFVKVERKSSRVLTTAWVVAKDLMQKKHLAIRWEVVNQWIFYASLLQDEASEKNRKIG